MTYPFRDVDVFLAPVGTPPPGFGIRDLLAHRSAYRCEIAAAGCTQVATDWHHRQRRREGDDTIVNSLHACRWCHRWVHEHPAVARVHGWIVSAWSSPGDVPVRRRGRWVLLTADGSLDPTTPPEGVQ